MPSCYTFDRDRRIWLRPSSGSIPYSDGEESETYLLAALRGASDVSAASSEIVALIRDWPSEYHLSPVRHNLLRSVAFRPSDRILELGCGCGGITRYLGESGATVIAVEGSKRRALIAAERCRDLANVTIVCDNIATFTANEEYDYVTLIGVLEYAPLFIRSEDPTQTYLASAKSLLKEDGELLLAIENKLGLKYFSGCKEDHVGIPYFGINDLYTAETPITFGKEDLTTHLIRSGFQQIEFFYPFPDYKLPSLILSEQGARAEKLNLRDLLIYGVSRDYPNTYMRAFADGLAWGPLADNHLLEPLANAFLVSASKAKRPARKADWLVKTYSRSYRRPPFLTETTIKLGTEDGILKVYKRSLITGIQNDVNSGALFRHVPADSDYIDGRLLLRDIQMTIARGGTVTDVATTFSPWISYLLSHANKVKGEKPVLPGSFIDCAPANLIVREDGSVEFFDTEWHCETDIPLSWTLVRGFCHSFNCCPDSRMLAGMSYRQFIDAVLNRFDLSLEEEDYRVADKMERQFMVYCHFSASRSLSLLEMIGKPLPLIPSLSAWYEAELGRVTNTLSWRMTRPLRVLVSWLRAEYRGMLEPVLRIYRKLRDMNKRARI